MKKTKLGKRKLVILHVLGCLGMGGAEGRIMDLIRNNTDENIHYDFLVHSDGPDYYDEEAGKLGCNIYRIPRYKIYNAVAYKKACKAFFSSHTDIDVVVGDMTSTAAIYLPIARKYGCVTVAHARSAGVDAGLKGRLTKSLRKKLPLKTQYMWACSSDAAKAVFGQDNYDKGLVKVIYDNIDVDSFVKTPEIISRAEDIRYKYKLDNHFVVGHVGSFRYPKNHDFLLKVFSYIKKKEENAVLLLVGQGELLEEIKKKADEMDISDSVIFAGQQSDIVAYYNVFDLFIFPSHFEGLPGTVLEAQASSLPVLCSDTITRDVDVTDYVDYYSLEKSPEEWAQYALDFYERVRVKENEKNSTTIKSENNYIEPSEILKQKGFDVHIESEKLNLLYHQIADSKPKRILNISGGMYPGGQENFIMNIMRNLDSEKTRFDVLLFYIREGDYVPEIMNLGNRVFLAPRKSRHPIKNFLEIKRIVKENKYEIVIRHSDNAFAIVDMIAARMGGAKTLIFHSHSSSSYSKGLHAFFRPWMSFAVNKRFACSENAGKWMYGNRDFKVIKNAIDIKKNIYNPEIREKVRREWNMEDKVVYAHVGIYFPVKNHLFLIKAFSYILEKQPNARLILIGEGEMRSEMEELIEELGITDKVILTGVRYDVPDLLQMADVFCFPSKYEGLPLSLIEAQAAGLKCIISKVITDEVIVTDLVTKQDIEEGEEAFAKKALELSNPYERQSTYEEIKQAGYDVLTLAKFYEDM